MRPIHVGLLGIGTVGGGTWEVLKRNADEIQRRAGRAIRITHVADKDVRKANAALIALIAKSRKIPKTSIEIAIVLLSIGDGMLSSVAGCAE
mgnify:CR=1 FL=1